ncbi:hypothetical protein RRG08_027494 [Elysia crispata]|uniref:Uncharacterized protein n=1 Tax=Elysia crispata TaxID=231223 RepID=A0AAE1D3Y8_9GAST|nr:hypothetical protein RRG08_027494 [Elysia crispata]
MGERNTADIVEELEGREKFAKIVRHGSNPMGFAVEFGASIYLLLGSGVRAVVYYSKQCHVGKILIYLVFDCDAMKYNDANSTAPPDVRFLWRSVGHVWCFFHPPVECDTYRCWSGVTDLLLRVGLTAILGTTPRVMHQTRGRWAGRTSQIGLEHFRYDSPSPSSSVFGRRPALVLTVYDTEFVRPAETGISVFLVYRWR